MVVAGDDMVDAFTHKGPGLGVGPVGRIRNHGLLRIQYLDRHHTRPFDACCRAVVGIDVLEQGVSDRWGDSLGWGLNTSNGVPQGRISRVVARDQGLRIAGQLTPQHLHVGFHIGIDGGPGSFDFAGRQLAVSVRIHLQGHVQIAQCRIHLQARARCGLLQLNITFAALMGRSTRAQQKQRSRDKDQQRSKAIHQDVHQTSPSLF